VWCTRHETERERGTGASSDGRTTRPRVDGLRPRTGSESVGCVKRNHETRHHRSWRSTGNRPLHPVYFGLPALFEKDGGSQPASQMISVDVFRLKHCATGGPRGPREGRPTPRDNAIGPLQICCVVTDRSIRSRARPALGGGCGWAAGGGSTSVERPRLVQEPTREHLCLSLHRAAHRAAHCGIDVRVPGHLKELAPFGSRLKRCGQSWDRDGRQGLNRGGSARRIRAGEARIKNQETEYQQRTPHNQLFRPPASHCVRLRAQEPLMAVWREQRPSCNYNPQIREVGNRLIWHNEDG
jgi:hypothetical protein